MGLTENTLHFCVALRPASRLHCAEPQRWHLPPSEHLSRTPLLVRTTQRNLQHVYLVCVPWREEARLKILTPVGRVTDVHVTTVGLAHSYEAVRARLGGPQTAAHQGGHRCCPSPSDTLRAEPASPVPE